MQMSLARRSRAADADQSAEVCRQALDKHLWSRAVCLCKRATSGADRKTRTLQARGRKHGTPTHSQYEWPVLSRLYRSLHAAPHKGWRRKFDDPIELPDGRKLGVAIVGGPIVA